MTWDELNEKQLEEIKQFREIKTLQLLALTKSLNATKHDFDSFYATEKKEREQLHKKHEAEQNDHIDQKKYADKQLAHFRKMAKEHPENEYWAEAVERMERAKKQEREEEIRRYNERMKANSREHER